MNITEDYCSYEVAKLLKEKGFDYQGFDYIDFEGEVIRQDRPTHQMAMKWLREVHKIHCNIDYIEDSSTYKYYIYTNELRKHSNFKHYDTYEQAVEAALKYSLENLI